MGKGKGEAYGGIGMGLETKIDSVSDISGAIHFSDKIITAPVLAFGIQAGAAKQTDIRLAFHLPKIFGGFGLRAGVQQSIFNPDSKFNVALGTDLGFVISKDSIHIFGSGNEINKSTNGAINADFFLPIGFSSQKNFRIVLTPRYSLNVMYVRKFRDERKSNSFKFSYPALSLGIRKKHFYFEATGIFYQKSFYPNFGVAWMSNL